MRFLANMASVSLSSCHLSVADFEKFAKANDHEVSWNGDEALAGAFKVQRKGSCIVSVSVPDWL
jgi:hypothetical protein